MINEFRFDLETQGTPGSKRKSLSRVEMLYSFKSVNGEFDVSRGQVRLICCCSHNY